MSSASPEKVLDPRNAEFIGLSRAMNWSQAETARQLNITPGAVSQICNGKTKPRLTTVNFLKALIGQKNPEALQRYERAHPVLRAPWEEHLVEVLRGFTPAAREGLLTGFYQIIEAVQATARRQKA